MAGIVLALVLSAVPAPDIFPEGVSCCRSTFGRQVLGEIERRPEEEDLESFSAWLQDRLRSETPGRTIQVLAAVEGRCAQVRCPPKLTAAKSTLERLIPAQQREEERLKANAEAEEVRLAEARDREEERRRAYQEREEERRRAARQRQEELDRERRDREEVRRSASRQELEERLRAARLREEDRSISELNRSEDHRHQWKVNSFVAFVGFAGVLISIVGSALVAAFISREKMKTPPLAPAPAPAVAVPRFVHRTQTGRTSRKAVRTSTARSDCH